METTTETERTLTARFLIALTPEQSKSLAKAAQKRTMSRAALLRDLLNDYLRSTDQEQPSA